LGQSSSTGRPLRGNLSRLSHEVGPWLYAVVLVCFFAIVAATYLGETTYVAGQMQEVERLERQLREIRWVNNDLLLEIAEHQPMSRIEGEAVALGLGPAQEYQYVEVMVEEPANAPDATAGKGGSGIAALLQHLPESLRRMLEQFAAWAAGPVLPAEDGSGL